MTSKTVFLVRTGSFEARHEFPNSCSINIPYLAGIELVPSFLRELNDLDDWNLGPLSCDIWRGPDPWCDVT